MSCMIEMPRPPEPPTLETAKIQELIDYAEKMAAFMEAEVELIHELGGATPATDLAPAITGWKFTAQNLRDSYNGNR